MPTKRRKLSAHRIGVSAAAIEAWKRGDWLALHRTCDLHPWEASPLPLEIEPIGCDQRTKEEDAAMPYGYRLWNASWPKAQELQRALLEVAGEPGEGALMSDELNEQIRLICEARGWRFRGHPTPWSVGDGPCPHAPGTALYDAWTAAQRLRRALIPELQDLAREGELL